MSAACELSLLCADRALATRERFEPNAYYGFDRILKRYAGLPDSFRLPAVIPHGVYLDAGYVWAAEAAVDLPAILVCEPYRVAAYAAATEKVIMPAASPWLYLLRLAGQPTSGASRRGTVLFPSHSTHHVTSPHDYEQLACIASELPAEMQPVTVCLYWRDVNLGRDEPFRARGLAVESAGHMYDPEFSFRLLEILSRHAHAAGNAFGSHIFYAAAVGCDYFHLGAPAELSVADFREPLLTGDVRVPPDPDAVAEFDLLLQRAFVGPDRSAAAQQQAAAHVLGAQALLAPAQLRADLVALHRYDRWGRPGRLRDEHQAKGKGPRLLRTLARRAGVA